MLAPESSPAEDRTIRAGLVATLLIAAALRFAGLAEAPPGLWFDEALNLTDAARVLGESPEGASGAGLRLVYPDVFPREGMFVALLAAARRAFGGGVATMRGVSASVGLATVAALFLALRSVAGGRIALAASAFLAGMKWHLIFSRLLFRTLLAPLWGVLVFAAAARARRVGSVASAATLGALIAGGFYTYPSWYFVAPGTVALAAWAIAGAPRRGARAAAAVSAFLVVAAPLALHYVLRPADLLARPDAVSPLKAESPARELAGNLVEALGMFHWKGDHVPKHNVPLAPALDPIAGGAFAIGLAACAARARRRDPLGVALLGWLALGIAPTVFAQTDSPNFLRTLVATPAVAGIAGVGLVAACEAGARFGRARGVGRAGALAAGAGVALVAAAGSIGARDVFAKWAPSPETWASFNGPESDLGRAAAEAPPGSVVFVPAHLAEHLSFRYRATAERPAPREGDAPVVVPYSDFAFLRPAPGDDRPRFVVATAHNRVYPVLEALVPEGRIARELRRPGGGVWALLYAIPPGAFPDPARVAAAEAAHPADVRW